MREFDSAVMEILSANPKDVPFAALYHVESPSGEGPSQDHTGRSLTFVFREKTERPDPDV